MNFSFDNAIRFGPGAYIGVHLNWEPDINNTVSAAKGMFGPSNNMKRITILNLFLIIGVVIYPITTIMLIISTHAYYNFNKQFILIRDISFSITLLVIVICMFIENKSQSKKLKIGKNGRQKNKNYFQIFP